MLIYVSIDMFCLVIWYDIMRVYSGRYVTFVEVSDIYDFCVFEIGLIRVYVWYYWKYIK